MYQRPPLTTSAPPDAATPDEPSPVARTEPEAPARATEAQELLPSGRAGAVVVAALLVFLVLGTRGFGENVLGVVVFPVAGIVGVVAFGRRCARVHPDEPWLPRLLLLGVSAKLMGSYLRYLSLTNTYAGKGDASRYDRDGRRFVAHWIGERASPPELSDLRSSNFMKWLAGVVYYLFGQSLVAAFLLFGLLAMIGSYFWYRAVADSVPLADKRIFLLFMMFAPSVVFWPSSLGKEALMQVGVGAMAWVTALLVTGRFLRAIPLTAGGGWLLWVVRPHLLALVAVAAAVPYFVGRVKTSVVSRPAGMAVVGVLLAITVSSGAKYLELNELSIDSVEARLDEQTASTDEGGSSYDQGGNSLTPLSLPGGLVTVLFRPFPWETSSAMALLASAESMVLIGLVVRRFGSVRLAFRRCRTEPFLLYCMVLLALYSVAFSSFANFGLLTRQRSLVLPALYVLIALDPARARRDQRVADVPELVRSGR